ncbi:MAG: class I SAM-dependent methyltransferase, partial [Acidobacteriota bacterium]
MIGQWMRTGSPRTYSALRRVYYEGLRVAEWHLFGSKLQELRWRMHRVYEDSHGDPHRAFLTERIGRFAPFESILEVGCSCGSNLVALALAYPDVKLYGVDISARAIRAAKRALARKDADGTAALFVGRADDLHGFADKSVDIVLTDATLMYVGPDRI